MSKQKKHPQGTIAQNKKARHDYHIDDVFEAAGVDPTARGEVLAIGDFARIAEQLIEVRR